MPVEVSRVGPATVITMDWPDTRNALGPDQADQIIAAVQGARDDGPLVLTGSGAFCAGGDLVTIRKIVADGQDAAATMIYRSFQGLIRELTAFPMPTIAAVDGPAIGLGVDLALSCDSVLVGDRGWFRQGWGQLGLIPAVGGLRFLERRSPGAVWRLLASQERLDAASAQQLGIAEHADGFPSALDAAVDRAAGLARVPRAALVEYVALMRRDPAEPLEAHLEAAREAQSKLLASPEFAERADQILGGQ